MINNLVNATKALLTEVSSAFHSLGSTISSGVGKIKATIHNLFVANDASTTKIPVSPTSLDTIIAIQKEMGLHQNLPELSQAVADRDSNAFIRR